MPACASASTIFDRLVAYDDIKAVFARLAAAVRHRVAQQPARCHWPRRFLPRCRRGAPEAAAGPRLGRLPIDRIGVSLEEPERFIYELEQRLTAAAPTKHTASRGSRAATARKRTRKREGA
jgi:hypothetical protein